MPAFDETSFFATLAVVIGPVIFLRGLRDLRTKRLIENTPTSKIRSLAMGLVEICGKTECRSTFAAPFSGRPCAFWEVDVSIAGGRRNTWNVVHRSWSSRPFFVRDETGLAMVDPRGARSRCTQEVTEECLGFMPPEPYASFLKEHAQYRRFLWTFSRLRFRERSVEEGQELYVLGTAEPRAQSVSISEPELLATGTDGALALRTEHVRSLDHQATAVIRRGRNDPTFILSAGGENNAKFDLTIQTGLKLLGGPLCTLFGLFYWLVRFSH